MSVDVTLTGYQQGQPVSLGTATREYVAEPVGDTVVDLEIPLAPGLDGARLDDVRLDVVLRGATALHGVLVMDGASHLELPVHDDVT